MHSFTVFTSIIIYALAFAVSEGLIWCFLHVKPIFKRRNIFWIIVISLPLAVIAGYRYGIGTDYFNYCSVFSKVTQYDLVSCMQQTDFEPVFLLLVKILSWVNNDEGFIFFTIELLTLVIAVYSFQKIDRKQMGFMFFLYCMLIYFHSYNIVRQALAISVVFLALSNLLDNRKIKFLICIAVATCIHRTAIVTVLYLLVYRFCYKKNSSNKKIVNYLYYAALIVSPLLFTVAFNSIISLSLFEKYRLYQNSSSSLGIGILVITLVLLSPSLFTIYNNKIENRQVLFLKDLALMTIPLSFASYIIFYAGRLLLYPESILVLMAPLIASDIQEKRKLIVYKALTLTIFLAYFIYNFIIMKSGEAIPYVVRN